MGVSRKISRRPYRVEIGLKCNNEREGSSERMDEARKLMVSERWNSRSDSNPGMRKLTFTPFTGDFPWNGANSWSFDISFSLASKLQETISIFRSYICVLIPQLQERQFPRFISNQIPVACPKLRLWSLEGFSIHFWDSSKIGTWSLDLSRIPVYIRPCT